MPGFADENSDVAAINTARSVAAAITNRVRQIQVIPLAAADTAGGAASVQNTTGVDQIIDLAQVDISAIAAGACALNVGVTSVNGTTSSNNLLTALDVHSAAGLFNNIDNKGASGKACQIWPAGKWVTVSVGSGASAGMVGNLIIHSHSR